MQVNLIYATSANGVIGNNGGIPWYIPGDLKRFKKLTTGQIVIMGRKTWESLPKKPLPNRVNIVITRQTDYDAPGAIVVGSVQQAFQEAVKHRSGLEVECYVIGGEAIYQEAVPYAHRHFITLVHRDVDGDANAPNLAMQDALKLFDPQDEEDTRKSLLSSGNSDEERIHILDLYDTILSSRPTGRWSFEEDQIEEFVEFADTKEPIKVKYDYLTIVPGIRSIDHLI